MRKCEDKLLNAAQDIVKFDYVDAPAAETFMRALELLNYLGALDEHAHLTRLGALMAEFPLDPQVRFIYFTRCKAYEELNSE